MTFFGFCEECGARHEAEEPDSCMCGGDIVPAEDHRFGDRKSVATGGAIAVYADGHLVSVANRAELRRLDPDEREVALRELLCEEGRR